MQGMPYFLLKTIISHCPIKTFLFCKEGWNLHPSLHNGFNRFVSYVDCKPTTQDSEIGDLSALWLYIFFYAFTLV